MSESANNDTKIASKPTSAPPGKRKLTRSDGRRWDRLQEVIKDEIKSQTSKFLRNRGKVRQSSTMASTQYRPRMESLQYKSW